MKLFELKQEHTAALDRAQSVIASAESADRKLTEQEQKVFDAHMAEATRIGARMKAEESVNTLSRQVVSGMLIPASGDPATAPSAGFAQPQANVVRFAEARTPEYSAALHQFLKSGGKAHGGELTAGADGEGAFTSPAPKCTHGSLHPVVVLQPLTRALRAVRGVRAAMPSAFQRTQ